MPHAAERPPPIGGSDEWLTYEGRREERWRRRLTWGLPLVLILLAAVGFGLRPALRGIREWQARRAAREAFALIDQEQWREASAKAEDAYLLGNSEPEAWRAMGRLLSRSGHGDKALRWWKQLDRAALLTPQDRRDFACAALAAGDLRTTSTQVHWLLVQKKTLAAGDLLLSAQLDEARGDMAHAIDQAKRALLISGATPRDRLSAASLILLQMSPASLDYLAAWKQLARLGSDTSNRASLDALALLATQRPLVCSPALFPGATEADGAMSSAALAAALDAHPQARDYHRLLALEVRARADPDHTDGFVTEAIQHYGNGDNETLAALASWLISLHRFEATLQVLAKERALQTRELAQLYADALAALGRWDELKEFLNAASPPLDPFSQHMSLAVDRAHLTEPVGAAIEWQRAMDIAGTNPDKLLALGAYAEKHDAFDAADAAFAAAIPAAPERQPAYAARGRLALARGQTTLARDILAEFTRRWPDDQGARIARAYLDLLLGCDAKAAAAAESTAILAAEQEPANWPARGTLALARLREGQTPGALAAFAGDHGTVDPLSQLGEDVPPGVRAVWAATLAANGWMPEASAAADQLTATGLLPEERALIRSLSQ